MWTERDCRVALAACPVLEPSTLRTLVSKLQSARAVWEASEEVLLQSSRMHLSTAEALGIWRKKFSPELVHEALRKRRIAALTQDDELYPKSLFDLAEPPIVVFARGDLQTLEVPGVAVVGTRRASNYGLEATAWIAQTLAGNGLCIISGLAVGIDAAAHQNALESGRTAAWLACGVDVCYPPSNRSLYESIVNKGVILSEYPPHTMVAKHRFPERNRLIAAMATAVIVVQAGEKSGALRTVDSALELGKEVYVVPGPITTVHFRGSHQLLQQGANLLTDPKDFLVNAGIVPAAVAPVNVPQRFRALYDALGETLSATVLAKHANMPISHVYAGLLEMELEGIVERVPGGLYRRCAMRTPPS